MPLHTQVTAKPAGGNVLVLIWAWVTGDGEANCIPYETDPPGQTYPNESTTTGWVLGAWDKTVFSFVTGSSDPGATKEDVDHYSNPSYKAVQWNNQVFKDNGPKKEYSFLLDCALPQVGSIRSELISGQKAPGLHEISYSCASSQSSYFLAPEELEKRSRELRDRVSSRLENELRQKDSKSSKDSKDKSDC